MAETSASDTPPPPVNITLLGAGGRMGRMLISAVAAHADCHLAGVVEHAESPLIGSDAGSLAGMEPMGVTLEADAAAAIARADAVIDFSHRQAAADHARLCAQAPAALIIGTTGLTAEDERALDAAARHCPVVAAPNMSPAITLLCELTRRVAGALDADYDIEILEMHHRHKVDAPSGTALALGRAATAGRGVTHADAAILSREGQTGARPRGAVGYACLRGGEVIGDHRVIFAGDADRIELSHKAGGRGIYAAGALRAALWAAGRANGRYDMRDVLGLT